MKTCLKCNKPIDENNYVQVIVNWRKPGSNSGTSYAYHHECYSG